MRPYLTKMMMFAGLVVSWHSAPLSADHLVLSVGNQTLELDGEILLEGQDQSLFFRQNNGKIWFVKPDQLVDKQDDDEPVEPVTKEQLGEMLLAELPDGFRIYETKHYVIAYQNELAYARWVGGLYESRLYRGFETFFDHRKKFELSEPPYPLAAVIFGSKQAYDHFVKRELNSDQEMIAYYNVQTNRVTMYDLTAGGRAPGSKPERSPDRADSQ